MCRMSMRTLPAPGNGGDLAIMPACRQCDDGIRHAQPRTNDQDTVRRRNVLQRTGLPWIGDQNGVMPGRQVQVAQQFRWPWRGMAGGDDHNISPHDVTCGIRNDPVAIR